jgi:uncharacterized membrane protein
MEEIAKIMWLMLMYGFISIALIYALKLIFDMNGQTSKTWAGTLLSVCHLIIQLLLIIMWLFFTYITIKQIDDERKNNNVERSRTINISDTTFKQMQ